MERLLGRTEPLADVAERLAEEFGRVFGLNVVCPEDGAAGVLPLAPVGDTMGHE
jgi:hypothetical protein